MVVETGSVLPPVAVDAPPSDGLTDLQRRFVQCFIENGGNSGQAAIDAGYGGGAENMGLRNLAKPKIQAEITRRVKLQTGTALHAALGRLLRIVEESDDDKAAVQAALGLMDRFGMAPPKGPAVAVQVNNTTVVGGQAQSIIGAIWADRQARLSSDAA